MAATTVSKATIIENVWRNFFDRIKDNVNSVTITNNGVADALTVTVKRYTSSFGDTRFDETSELPIIVIDTPNITTDYFTLTKTQVEGTIDIEVYARQGEAAQKFLDAIINSIETYKDDLADAGLHMVELDSTDSDAFERGRIRVHMKRARFTFVFRYSKTIAY